MVLVNSSHTLLPLLSPQIHFQHLHLHSFLENRVISTIFLASMYYICLCAQLLQSCPTLFDPVDIAHPGFSCPWDSPGKNTGVGCRALLQRIYLTQEWKLRLLLLLHCKRILYPLSHLGSPIYAVKWSVKVKVAQLCLTLCDPMAIQSMEFSRPEYWSG